MDLASIDLEKLSPNEAREMLALLEELEARKEGSKLFDLYPDDGPLRRELYPKHLEFFAGGNEHMERCMMAANRVGKCVHGSTVIETVDGERTAHELWDRGESFRVWAWDGEARTQAVALAPFKKAGMHQCYRVKMSDGRWFDAADQHRVLTSDGFYYLDELHQLFVSGLLESSLERGPSAHALSELRLKKTLVGCLDRCSESFRRYGEQLHCALDSGLEFSPSQGGALPHTVALSSLGDQENKYTSIHRRVFGHLSSQGEDSRHAAPFSAFPNYSASTISRWLTGFCQGDGQPELGSVFRSLSCGELDQCKGGIERQPLSLPSVDGAKITSIEMIGIHEVYDFHVPRYENYITSGVVHHNTWGVGGYEVALHLTGLYPDWWVGRRWDSPVDAWAAGDTLTTTRDILQSALLGLDRNWGTGLIPRDNIIGQPTMRGGVTGAVDFVSIQHVSGGRSILGFKAYDQGRKTFQGTAKHITWLDEEPPIDVYEECLLRLATTNGSMICTFTPLLGLSKVALKFLPGLAPGGEA